MNDAAPRVRHFRQSLLWPLQIEAPLQEAAAGRHWARFAASAHGPWRRVDDEFTENPADFRERHYREFVTFLPYVQRFLYGEGRSQRRRPDDPPAPSPMHVFRRADIAALRLTLTPRAEPLTLPVVHVDLHFFHDLDVALLNVEIRADDLPLDCVRDILFRFGRAYPSGWDEDSEGVHSAHRVEWLAADGSVLAVSDASHRQKYLEFVCAHRTPAISAHWSHLLRPLVLADSDDDGELRYRLLEYHRMPTLAFLALDDPTALSREDWVRIGLATKLHPAEALPEHDPMVAAFEARYAQDRYWTGHAGGPNTRYLCTGNALTVVGSAGSRFFLDAERGVLAQFRHQHYLVFLIAHLHRAALLAFSDALVDAVNDLDIRDDASVRRFKRRIRATFETFLRFTHRYWFHEISERSHVQALFRLCAQHLGNDKLYAEVRDEIREMGLYLDSDSQRRQSNTVVRLTVVTILGLIGTVTTGWFGMNLMALAERPLGERLGYFAAVLAGTGALTLFAIARSKRLSDLLETIADERAGWRERCAALGRVFRRDG